jgi:membrane protease subunit HflK
MANDDGNLSSDAQARRSVARTIANTFLAIAVLAGLGAWEFFFGFYTLYPGQAAIILRLGKYERTVSEQGPNFHLPAPLETHEIVKVDELRKEEFGVGGVEEGAKNPEAIHEASMQTEDNAIVRLSFVVQYKYGDAYKSRYSLRDPRSVLRDAAQAAVREVVGRMTIEDVLSERRDEVAADSERILQKTLDDYGAGILVDAVQLQEVQPPEEVRQAFDDVIAASQDANRAVNEAEGYRNEVLPKARGEAAEIVAAANGYREAKIAEATGEAARFLAVEKEYSKAPGVTRERIYLETMEAILPSVNKVVIEKGTTQVLPYLPLGGREGGRKP